jgi:Flp pilus assembly pilin Flp
MLKFLSRDSGSVGAEYALIVGMLGLGILMAAWGLAGTISDAVVRSGQQIAAAAMTTVDTPASEPGGTPTSRPASAPPASPSGDPPASQPTETAANQSNDPGAAAMAPAKAGPGKATAAAARQRQ